MANEQLQTVTGVIEGANDNGVKMNGEWMNYSKWFQGTKPAPSMTGMAATVKAKPWNGKLMVQSVQITGKVRTSDGVAAEVRDRHIVRQSSLERALQTLTETEAIKGMAVAEAKEAAMMLAEEYMQWVMLNGDEPEPEEEPPPPEEMAE